ncbi:hypothetical protein, partial [Novosphingobium sp. JCM 18896]|uniref:hypothetical protein n=1 Tax=Novosphingobium sp. JCM 18896 TaxID=2989731 RepID=UPI002223612B
HLEKKAIYAVAGCLRATPSAIPPRRKRASNPGPLLHADPGPSALSLERQAFWSEFLSNLRLDDQAQPLPNPAKQGYITFSLPAPGGSSWLTVWRDLKLGNVGVTLGWTRGELGEEAGKAIVEYFEKLAPSLGGNASLKTVRGRVTIGDEQHVGDLQSAESRAAAYAWLRHTVNVWINVLRPEVQRLVAARKGG